VDPGERARVDPELGSVEDLDAGVLLTVERGHDGRGRSGLAAQLEREVRVVEPEPEVVLVGRRELGRAARRDREGLDIEDAPYRDKAVAVAVGVGVGVEVGVGVGVDSHLPALPAL